MQIKPYRTLAQYYRELGYKHARKLTIDAGFSCPNRDGSLSDRGCIYCDNSSFSQNTNKRRPIKEQIEAVLRHKKSKEKFSAYFQAFTNTYATVEKLSELYDQILPYPEIFGLSIGTRPDCVDEEKIALINKFAQKYDTWIEYGLQSANDETLKAINRGHNFKTFVEAFKLTRKYKKIKICVHVIIGLPGENDNDVLNTAKHLSELNPDGIKIHPAHILKNTVLEKLYTTGKYTPITLKQYAKLTVKFLELQNPNTVIHRISADCGKEMLVGPKWILDKEQLLDAINSEFKKRASFQGKFYTAITV